MLYVVIALIDVYIAFLALQLVFNQGGFAGFLLALIALLVGGLSVKQLGK
jgi:hypothetical protein